MAQSQILYSIRSLLRDSFGGVKIYRISCWQVCKPVNEDSSYVIPEKYLVEFAPYNASSGDSNERSERNDGNVPLKKQAELKNSTPHSDER